MIAAVYARKSTEQDGVGERPAPNCESRNTMKTLTTILALLLAMVCVSADVVGQSLDVLQWQELQSAGLAGLTTVNVVVSVSPGNDSPELKQRLEVPELSEATIRDRIELEIRRSSNLRILPTAPATLRVNVMVLDVNAKPPRTMVGFFRQVDIEVIEPVRLARNGFLEPATTWRSNIAYGWGSDLSGTLPQIDRALTQFLNAYLAANPRAVQ
jgi:hypothetical protein